MVKRVVRGEAREPGSKWGRDLTVHKRTQACASNPSAQAKLLRKKKDESAYLWCTGRVTGTCKIRQQAITVWRGDHRGKRV